MRAGLAGGAGFCELRLGSWRGFFATDVALGGDRGIAGIFDGFVVGFGRAICVGCVSLAGTDFSVSFSAFLAATRCERRVGSSGAADTVAVAFVGMMLL